MLFAYDQNVSEITWWHPPYIASMYRTTDELKSMVYNHTTIEWVPTMRLIQERMMMSPFIVEGHPHVFLDLLLPAAVNSSYS